MTPAIAVLMTAMAGSAQVVAYTGMTLWDGTGAPALTNATMVVAEGQIMSVGASAQPPPGAEIVFLAGKSVVPPDDHEGSGYRSR